MEAVLYARVQRLTVLARCNPDLIEFTCAYWQAVDALRDQQPAATGGYHDDP